MNNSKRIHSPVAFRPEWKENLCSLFVVAAIVAAIVLTEASMVRGTSATENDGHDSARRLAPSTGQANGLVAI